MPRRRLGFTLVETLVALVLLQIAMLALAATAMVAARDLSDALIRRRAYEVARNRTDFLRAGACASGGSGAHSRTAGLVEYWRVESAGASRAITDSVSAPLTRGRVATSVSRAWVICGL
jgi:Tfp pilus assembly protein PilV